jgi:hypothetical protein
MVVVEKQAFLVAFLSPVEKLLGKNPSFIPYIDRVKGNFDTFVKTVEELTHPELTEKVVEGDNLRDGGIVGLKSNAARSANRKDPAWVDAGKLILRVFSDLGNNMANLPLEQETTSIDNLLAEIDRNPALKAAITTIQSDAWLQDIRDGQKIVKDAFEQRRAGGFTSNTLPSTVDASKPLALNMEKLIDYINLKVDFEPTAELTALANGLNDIIDDYNAKIKLRETLRKQEKEKKEQEKDKK